MASLAGKADPVLARMAYAAGMANVPADLSGIYKSNVEDYKLFHQRIRAKAAIRKAEKKMLLADVEGSLQGLTDQLSRVGVDSD